MKVQFHERRKEKDCSKRGGEGSAWTTTVPGLESDNYHSSYIFSLSMWAHLPFSRLPSSTLDRRTSDPSISLQWLVLVNRAPCFPVTFFVKRLPCLSVLWSVLFTRGTGGSRWKNGRHIRHLCGDAIGKNLSSSPWLCDPFLIRFGFRSEKEGMESWTFKRNKYIYHLFSHYSQTLKQVSQGNIIESEWLQSSKYVWRKRRASDR